jgi:hypothetical protein
MLQELGNWCWQYCREQDARAALQQPTTPPPPASGAEQRAADMLAQHQVQRSMKYCRQPTAPAVGVAQVVKTEGPGRLLTAEMLRRPPILAFSSVVPPVSKPASHCCLNAGATSQRRSCRCSSRPSRRCCTCCATTWRASCSRSRQPRQRASSRHSRRASSGPRTAACPQPCGRCSRASCRSCWRTGCRRWRPATQR